MMILKLYPVKMPHCSCTEQSLVQEHKLTTEKDSQISFWTNLRIKPHQISRSRSLFRIELFSKQVQSCKESSLPSSCQPALFLSLCSSLSPLPILSRSLP
mmetsp:Transcript_11430/g.26113  ORF Transcript_11430/g.26113 Transcript_11430/m.26113 type:complete len:100 (+) Transcript_11430:2323-2622(+)